MNDDSIYLRDILERIERIESYTQEGKETFYQSLLIQDGVIRCFEVIGEVVKQLSPEIKQKIENNLPSLKEEIVTVIFNETNRK